MCTSFSYCMISLNNVVANRYFDKIFPYISEEVWNSINDTISQCLTNEDTKYLISQLVRSGAVAHCRLSNLDLSRRQHLRLLTTHSTCCWIILLSTILSLNLFRLFRVLVLLSNTFYLLSEVPWTLLLFVR